MSVRLLLLMQQMDVILGIVYTSANNWHIHALVLSVPDCSKCALTWISACTGDFEMHSCQLGNETTLTSIILYKRQQKSSVEALLTLILHTHTHLIWYQALLNTFQYRLFCPVSMFWPSSSTHKFQRIQKSLNFKCKLTWSTNPLIIERCFEGYDAKMLAVALAPVTANSPFV